MAKVLILALSAPLLLIGAAYPDKKPGAPPEYYPEDVEAGVAAAPVTYRPCRPGPGDDNCIQLYERGVRTAYSRWLRDHDVGAPRTRVAMGGPIEESGHRPRRRHHGGHDHRCDRHDGERG